MKIVATVLLALVAAAQAFLVDKELLAAVWWKESNFNPLAVGDLDCGVALGGGQQNLAGAGAKYRENPSALLDPRINAMATAEYLRACLDAFAGDKGRAVSAYNQGIGGATRSDWYAVNGANYVEPIMAKYREFLENGLVPELDPGIPERYREYGLTWPDIAATLLGIATDSLETGRKIVALSAATWGNR